MFLSVYRTIINQCLVAKRLIAERTIEMIKGTVHLFGFFHGKLNSPCAVEWY